MDPHKRQILVTGATGFVGQAVVSFLVQSGYNPRGLARETGDTTTLERMQPNVAVHRGDLTDKRSLVAAMDGCDWVLNCAGLNSFWESDAQFFHQSNVEGTRNVMEAALEARVSKVVHVSTAMAYGFPETSPFDEQSEPGIHVSEYARSKYEGDRIAWELHKTSGLPLVVVYLAAVVGAGDRKAVMQISRFLRGQIPAMIDSQSQFTYVHVGDAAKAIVRAAEKEGNEGERYLVGNQRLTTMEYFGIISQVSGVAMPRWTIGRRTALLFSRLMSGWARLTKSPPLMPYDLMRTAYQGSLLFDGSKAERDLGISYTPVRVALEEAIGDVTEQDAQVDKSLLETGSR
ncbi:MAG: NAD-dependent epimerase/dehydratase family protein [Anaerolineae bacterium]